MAKKKKKKVVKKKTNNKKKNISAKKNDIKKSTVKKATTNKNNSKNTSNKSTNKKISTNTSINKKKSKKRNNILEYINIKLVLIIFVVLLIVLSIFFLFIDNKNNKTNTNYFEKINIDSYMKLYDESNKTIEYIYLYNSSCISCNTYEDNLSKLESEFKIKIKKFDYTKLSDKELERLKTSNSFLEDGITIPTLLSIKNGKENLAVGGVRGYSALKNFVLSSREDEIKNSFNKIDVDEYLSILGSKDKSIIYICDSSADCNKFSMVLDEVSKNKKIKINYLNTENINSNDDWKKIESSNKIFSKMWFMPVIMVVKDNNIINYKMEVLNKTDLNKFLSKNGF